MRQRIIEDHKLAAVISLANKSGSLFSGAGILIFSEVAADADDKIWFCKMKAGLKKKDVGVKQKSLKLKYRNKEMKMRKWFNIINRWKNLSKENDANENRR